MWFLRALNYLLYSLLVKLQHERDNYVNSSVLGCVSFHDMAWSQDVWKLSSPNVRRPLKNRYTEIEDGQAA